MKAKWVKLTLRVVVPWVVALCFLALLLGVLAGPQSAAQAAVRLPPAAAPRAQAVADHPSLSLLAPPAGDLSQQSGPATFRVCAAGCDFESPQEAVNAVPAHSTVQVAEGTYTDDDGDGYVVRITKTVILQGGYVSPTWDLPDADAHPTYLDGEGSTRVIYVGEGVWPTIEGFHIRGGSAADYGGGVYVAGGQPRLRRSRIYSCQAGLSGGGVYLAGGAAVLENNLIYANTASSLGGGGIYVADGSAALRYNVVYGNQAGQRGGGLYVRAGLPEIVGTIVASNTAPSTGGLYNEGGTPDIHHNHFWGNANGNGSTGTSSVTGGPPLFVDAAGANFHLRVGSPSIDRGDPDDYPPSDYDGMSRPLGVPDIGAYESYAGRCFARVGMGPITNTVQAAVDAAGAGQEVKVAGWCTGTGAAVASVNVALTLRGGYTLTNWGESDLIASPTVLDGEEERPVIVVGNVAATIEGLHVYRGSSNQSGGGISAGNGGVIVRSNRVYSNVTRYRDGGGGGVYIAGGAFVLQGNQVYSNVATAEGVGGGGVYVAAGSGIVRDNDIYTNTAETSVDSSAGGGGLYIGTGSILVEDNRVYDNRVSGYGGGGIYVNAGSSILRGNEVYGNAQGGGNNGGGGIYVFQRGNVVVEGNTIWGNTVAAYSNWDGGGGIFLELDGGSGTAQVRNNVIYDNRAADEGGGIYVYNGPAVVDGNTVFSNTALIGGGIRGGNATLRNNIVVSNTGGRGTLNACHYCDVWGNTNDDNSGATGAFSDDPLFADAEARDFQLQPASPCRDQADPLDYPQQDFRGNARPFGLLADVGAYEFYTGTCFARVDGAGQVYADVQSAILTAPVGAEVRVAGLCQGVTTTVDGGTPFTQTAYISKGLTLRGGYTVTQWATPTTRTVLDPGGEGRGITITGTEAVTVDGFIVQNGDANGEDGGGVYVAAPAVEALVQNVVLYGNQAGNGGGLAAAGGSPRLIHNTVVANEASGEGGGVYIAAGAPLISNSIVASNTGAGLAGAVAVECAYCDLYGNSGGNGNGGPGAFSEPPGFVDFAGGDFHLRPDSPCIFAGDPATALDHDWEGDFRPQGRRHDVGADESTAYPGLAFEPKQRIDLNGAPGRSVVHTHYLTNTGSVADTFNLAYSIAISGISALWSVEYVPSFNLEGGVGAVAPVTVHVPADEISGSLATVVLTATSQAIPALREVVSNTTVVNWSPGVTVTPPYSTYLNPGQWITYPHTVRNLGNALDSFELISDSLFGQDRLGWGISPTQLFNLDPDVAATVWLTVRVPGTMPGGITETIVVTAINSTGEAWAVVTDTFQVNRTPGDRYVSTGGTDELNNCLDSRTPCRTIGYALQQALNGDAILVAGGNYNEHGLELDKDVTLRGGYNNWGDPPDPAEYPTVINAQSKDRVLYIYGNATVEGMVLFGGVAASSSGGGVYIGSGAPTLRNNVLTGNRAGVNGGGLYVAWGNPTIEQNQFSSNSAYRGAGLAVKAGAPRIWSNVVYANAAGGEGGGVYVSGGSPQIWHATVVSNSAPYGGGLYLADGTPTVSNTIVVSNSAAVAGGGVYSAAVGAWLDYNDVWHNRGSAGYDEYVGLTHTLHTSSVHPIFVNPAAGDLHLHPESPLIDVADATVVPWAMEGVTRTIGPRPDTGAYEFEWGQVEIAPYLAGLVYSGDVIAYPHTVTHTAKYTDTFELTGTSRLGLAVTVVPDELTLGANMTETVWVMIAAPVTDVVLVDTAWITISSRAYPVIADAVTDTTYINVVSGLEMTPNREGKGEPGSLIWYSHTLTNTGNYTDVVDLKDWLSVPNWQLTMAERIEVGPGEAVTVDVGVLIDARAISGTIHTAVVTATSMFSHVINGVHASATVTDVTTVQPVPRVDVRRPDRWSEGYCVYPQGESVLLAFVVQNIGNLADTYELTAVNTIEPGWPLTVTDFYTVISDTTLVPQQESIVWVEVYVPEGTPYEAQNVVTLIATSTVDGTVWDSEFYRLTILDVDLTIDGDTRQVVGLTQTTLAYTHLVTNTGTETVYAQLQHPEGASPPRDWGTAFGGQELISDQVAAIPVTVTIPINYPAPEVFLPVTETVIVEAMTDAPCRHHTLSVSDQIMVNRPNVWLEPDYENQNVYPGSVVTYSLRLTNTGSTVDDFTLSLNANPAPGWTASVVPLQVRDLPPRGSALVTAVITVPIGIPMGDAADLMITATSGYTEAILDTAAIEMIPQPTALLFPDNRGEAQPEQTVVYTHVLTSLSNRSEVFDLTTSRYATVEPVMVTLEPSESAAVTVTVQLPPHAQIGRIEDTEVNVSFGDEENRRQVVAHDLTLVLPVPGTRYVAPDGQDRDNNCRDLDQGPCATVQHAVDQAALGDEIRVARGLYTDVHPATAYSPVLTQVVHLTKSVVIRGGYAITDWGHSYPALRPTVLDADGQGRVIVVAAGYTPTIAGFELRGGYVVGDGGGVYLIAGAMPRMEGNDIHDNQASGGRGGGIYDGGPGEGVASPTVQRNTLHDNRASDGAGAYLAGSSTDLWNNVFYHNRADALGGGLYVYGGTPTVWNNTFYSNTSDHQGGGIYVLGTSLSISNNLLVANRAQSDGGGLYVGGGGTPALSYNGYWDNVPNHASGTTTGTQAIEAAPLFADAAAFDLRLQRNSPYVDAGDPQTTVGRDRDGKERPLLEGYDVGAYEYGLWASKKGPVYVASEQTITYTIVLTNVSGQVLDKVPVTDALSSDLAFAGMLIPADGEYLSAEHVVSWTVSLLPYEVVELAFTARVSGELATGAPVTNVAWVDLGRTNVVTTLYRTCWVRLNDSLTDYVDVQSAVDAGSSPDDVVKIAGRCAGVHAREGVTQVVYLTRTLTLRGGYTPDNWITPDLEARPATLDARGEGRVICVTPTLGIALTPTIEGLVLTGGQSDSRGGGLYARGVTLTLNSVRVIDSRAEGGAGLAVEEGRAAIAGSVFSDNVAAVDGGGLYLYASTVALDDSEVYSNAAGFGGGLYATQSDGTIQGSVFAGNGADEQGGGAFVDGGEVLLRRNRFAENRANQGAGLWVGYGQTTLERNVVYSNSAGLSGGGLYVANNSGTEVWLTNNVVADNWAASLGSGVYVVGTSSTGSHLVHNTLARNAGGDGSGVHARMGSRVWLTNTILVSHTVGITVSASSQASLEATLWGSDGPYGAWGNDVDWGGEGAIVTGTVERNLWGNPAFVDSDQGDYHIRPNSAAVDAGVDAGVGEDLDGETRPVNDVPDLGADEMTSALTVAKYASADMVRDGQTLTYTLYVTNSGNTVLQVTVTDTLPARADPTGQRVWSLGTLTPGAGWTYEIPVTAEVGYAGVMTNVVEATAQEGVTGTAEAYVLVVGPAIQVVKTAYSSTVNVGQMVTYAYTVTNEGNVSLSDLRAVDLPLGEVVLSAATLAPGEVATGTLTYTVGEADLPGPLTNTVTVSGTAPIVGVITDTDSAVVELTYHPRIEVLKLPAQQIARVGPGGVPPAVVTFTIVVTNGGDVSLSPITVTDELAPACGRTLAGLGVGASERYTCTLGGVTDDLTNTVVVTGVPPAGAVVTATSEAAVEVVRPAIEIAKTPDRQIILPGDTVTFTIAVTNVGDMLLNGVEVSDALAPSCDRALGTLDPGITRSYACTVGNVVTDLLNTAQATGTPPVGVVVTDVDTARVEIARPGILVRKLPDRQPVQSGDPVTFTLWVTNTGNVSLVPVTLTDAPAPQCGRSWAELDENEGVSTTCTVADVRAPFTNTVWVTGTPTLGSVVTDVDQAEVYLIHPRIEVLKMPAYQMVRVGPGGVPPAMVTFTIAVTNTGDVTLTGVTVGDALAPACGRAFASLLEGASERYTCTVGGVTDDLTNTVVVTGVPPAGAVVTGVSEAAVDVIHPAIEIAKTPDRQIILPGDTVTFTIAVTNAGDVSLSGVEVGDVLAPSCDRALGTLDPGITRSYACTVGNVVTDLLNTALVTGTPPVGAVVTDADAARVEIVRPDVLVHKLPDRQPVQSGDPVTFTIAVTNTGNASLSPITLTDALAPACDRSLPGLDEGESFSYTCAVADVRASFTNTAWVTGAPWLGVPGSGLPLGYLVTDTDTAEVYLIHPRIAVTKTPHSQEVPSGGTAAFTITVVNAGDADLSMVTVVDPLAPDCSRTLGLGVGMGVEYACAQTNVTQTYTNTVWVSGTPPVGRVVAATDAAYVEVLPAPPEGVLIAGPAFGVAWAQYAFTATVQPITASQPISYAWLATEQVPVTQVGRPLSDVVRMAWDRPGLKLITVTADNGLGVVSDIHAITISTSPTCPAPLDGVSISGRSSGYANVLYTMQAGIAPPAATPPVVYTWSPTPETGQGTASADYRWPAPGVYTVTLRAQNCGGTVHATHTITIAELMPIYLPVVMSAYDNLPDLEVSDIQIVMGEDQDYILVGIRNNGPAPVTADFWVDLYLDPSSVPTVGRIWPDLSAVGKAWFVRRNLAPGERYEVDTRWPDDPDNPDLRYSWWPDQLPEGTHEIYVQADSYWTPYGMVYERDETNNVSLPVPYTKGAAGPSLQPTPQSTPAPWPTRKRPAAVSTPVP